LPESAKRKLKRKAYQAAPEITVETSARDGAAGAIGAGGGGGNERKQLPIGISIARNGQERLKNRELLAGGVKMGGLNRRSLDRWHIRPMKPVAQAEEERQPLIDGSDLFPRKLTEYAPDPPLVDRSQMVDQREGLLGEAALAGRQGRYMPLNCSIEPSDVENCVDCMVASAGRLRSRRVTDEESARTVALVAAWSISSRSETRNCPAMSCTGSR
jgi:hypothetical protein